MKTSILIQFSLLAAGLLLGGTSAVHADDVYTIILRGGDYHSPAHDYRSCRYTSRWYSGHRNDNGYYSGHHWEPHGTQLEQHRGPRHKGGKHGDTGKWRQGKLDDRNDAGHRGQQPGFSGIGYTGRS